MVRNRLRNRSPRHQVEHVETHVGAFQQEFQRRVRHEIARRHEGEQPKLVLGGGGRGAAVNALSLEGAALEVERVAAIAVEVLDGREVHQDSSVLGLRDHPLDQLGAQRRQVLSVESALGETREPGRLRPCSRTSAPTCGRWAGADAPS